MSISERRRTEQLPLISIFIDNRMSIKQKIMPLGDRVVVKPFTEQEKKTKSGILIPETVSKERPEQGKVIAVGEGKWNEDGDARVQMSVKVGDVVLFSKYGPDEVKIDGEEYYVLREDSILAVIKK
jgi:chaperonin GroES